MTQTVEPCGCVVTVEPGHVHTKLCERHRRETFEHCYKVESSNLDLVGG